MTSLNMNETLKYNDGMHTGRSHYLFWKKQLETMVGLTQTMHEARLDYLPRFVNLTPKIGEPKMILTPAFLHRVATMLKYVNVVANL